MSIITEEEIRVEHRMYVRHRARTRVQISAKGIKPKMCKAKNLSAWGVAIETSGMGLKAGMVVTLSFVIELGTIVKIHRRTAKVVHVTNGVTGFAMEAYKS